MAQNLGSVRGNVVASDTNVALANAAILLRPVHQGGAVGAIVRANTDEKGEFALPNLAPGRYMLTAERAGYGRVTYSEGTAAVRMTTFTLKPGEAKTIRLRLSPLGTVSGSVVGPDGAPLPRVRVILSHYIRVDGALVLAPEREVPTDQSGAFVVSGVPAGKYFLNGYSRGEAMYAPSASQPVQVELGRTVQGLKVQLTPAVGFGVFGHVVDGSGTPVAGVSVAARRQPEDGIPNLLGYDAATAKTGAAGEFLLPRLFPGKYRVDVTGGAQKLTGFSTVDVAQDVKGVTITAGPGAVVTGRIIFEGNFPGMKTPVSPHMARISMHRDLEAGGSPIVIQHTAGAIADDATFRIENVPPGPMRFDVGMSTDRYYLMSIRQNGRDLTDETLDVAMGDSIDNVEVVISVNAGQLSGRVLPETGTVKPEVIVFPAQMETPRGRQRLTRVARVNESGQFTIHGIAPGEYNVVAVRNAQEGSEGEQGFQSAVQPLAKRVTMAAGRAGVGVLQAVDAPR